MNSKKETGKLPVHSPPPWRSEGERRLKEIGVDPECECVPIHNDAGLIGWFVPCNGWNGPSPDSDLMIASPDLLVALEKIESLLDEAANFLTQEQVLPCDSGDLVAEELAEVAMRARDVIAKAKGMKRPFAI